MKGQHLVIGIVLFVIVIVAAIYFTVMATFNNDQNGMEQDETIIEIIEDSNMQNTPGLKIQVCFFISFRILLDNRKPIFRVNRLVYFWGS